MIEVLQLVVAQVGEDLMMVTEEAEEVVAMALVEISEVILVIEILKEVGDLVDILDLLQLKNPDLHQNLKSHQQVIFLFVFKFTINYFKYSILGIVQNHKVSKLC